LGRVRAFADSQRVPCALVGGLLRDQLLGRPLDGANVDLAVPRGALAFARALAAHLGGAYVPLDESSGTARVVVTASGGPRAQLDINEYRAPTLDEDLALRDFTINALAVALGDWLARPDSPGPVVDPLEGRAALAARALLPCFPGAFRADPLRVLRGARFIAQLGFALAPSARMGMREAVPRLAAVSGERIRDELLAILETDQASLGIALLDDLGALDVLLPELVRGRGVDQGDFHHLDVLGHQLEAVRQGDRILAGFAEFSEPLRDVLGAYCAVEPVESRTRKCLIKLGALLHDIGKPDNRQVHDDGEIWFIGHEHGGAELLEGICRRLCLSNRESEMLIGMVRHHLRPGFLSRELVLTRRALYRFYKDLGEHGPACLIMWWCDRMATRGRKSRVDQIDQQRARLEEMLEPYFFKSEEIVAPPRLIDGHRLMREFDLRPGPVIGALLGLIEEAQAEGRVATDVQALELARAHLATLEQS